MHLTSWEFGNLEGGSGGRGGRGEGGERWNEQGGRQVV